MTNKFIKAIAYAGVHILVALEIYLIALVVTSPVLGIVYGILDVLHKVPSLIHGRYLVTWLLASVLVWIVMLIYTEIKTHNLHTGLSPKDK